MRLKKRVRGVVTAAAAVVLAGGFVFSVLTYAPGGAPETATVRAGETVTLTVTADRVSDLYGCQFRLRYDGGAFRYEGGLVSLTPGLDTIFGKELDDGLLVGATMVGRKEGAALEDAPVCRVTLTALRDAAADVSIDEVHIVGSDLTYAENVAGWTVTAE
ncbi:MAG: cohesin domain-containing protein [Oscillospiraceae bacterium]|jgi:hypothetical protein|nr:cohesin domain-containing protein [Oscillospiraceae bacterium]